jgi:hypothetical protein
MKKLIFVFIVLCSLQSIAQRRDYLPIGTHTTMEWEKCGTWETLKPYYTNWTTVDTLGNKKYLNMFVGSEMKITSDSGLFFNGPKIVGGYGPDCWVYDELEPGDPNISSWTYDPCGSRSDEVYEQYRIHIILGIRQKRQLIKKYKYIPPPKNIYEQVCDSLSKLK